MEGKAGRVLDFWVDRGRHNKFWVVSLSPNDAVAIDYVSI